MSAAYIIKDRQDEYVQWQYTENESEIIQTPFDGLIFIPEDNDKDSAIQLLVATMNYPPLILNNLKIFNYINTDYHLKTVKLFTNPAIDYGHMYYHQEELKKYIIESQKPFIYIGSFDSNFKKELNQLGLYIHPIQKMLEYNPKKAKIQLTRITKKKKKSNYLKHHHLSSFAFMLRRVISINAKIHVSTNLTGRNTKKTYSDEILILADLYNLLFKKNSYRKFKVFKEAMVAWKTTIDKTMYSKNFIKWMDYESSLKPIKKTDERWNIKPKAVFKINDIGQS